MDAQAIIAVVTAVATAAKIAIEAGRDAAPYIDALYQTFTGKEEISEEELTALQERSDALSAELQAPLPPEE